MALLPTGVCHWKAEGFRGGLDRGQTQAKLQADIVRRSLNHAG